jgi:F-type H+-transporting ATPase subunit epsilon
MKAFHLSIRTPEGVCFDGEVESMVVPGPRGSFGILGGHAPMLAAVIAGVLGLQADGEPAFYVIGDGTLDVRDNRVALLLESAERAASRGDAGDRDLARRRLHSALRV